MSKFHAFVSSLAAIAAALPALAQQPAGESNGALAEIVVSAQYKQERLQDTALAISAMSAEDLQARSLSNVTQLAAMVPNAVISPLGAGYGSTIAAFIRGIGLGDNSLSFEPGVPIYIDDVYMGRPQGTILDLLDLERVEVLRGPQGTLFGKNAVGGAVRLISKKPKGDGTGYFEGTTGSFNRIDIRGSWDISVVFYSIYTDQQLSVQDCLPCAPVRVPWFRTVNTGKSRIWGVEAELNAQPLAGWKVEASLGYINYWLVDPGVTTLHARLPNGDTYYPNRTPKWNYGAGTEYTMALGDKGTLTPRVDWTYQSKIYFNNSAGFQDGYGLLSARLTWAAPDDKWSVALFGTNLTNKVYFDGKLALQAALGRESGNVAAPREWGLSLRRNFN